LPDIIRCISESKGVLQEGYGSVSTNFRKTLKNLLKICYLNLTKILNSTTMLDWWGKCFCIHIFNSTEQSFTCEANNYSARQEITCISWSL